MGDEVIQTAAGVGLVLGGAALMVFGQWYGVSLIAAGGSLLAAGAQDTDTKQKDRNYGIRANTRTTDAPYPVVYGKRLIGSNDVYIASTGTENKYLWIVSNLSEGPCSGIDTDENDNPKIFLDDDEYKSLSDYVVYYFHKGDGSQIVNSNLNSVKPEWTDCKRYTCYIVWRLKWDEGIWTSFPARKLVLKGREIYDVRDGSTSWSQNAPLQLWDFLTNGRYGMGIPAGYLDEDSWKAAANYYDGKGWESNLVVAGNDNADDIVDILLASFRGKLINRNNKLYLKYCDLNEESSVMTITDEHILQQADGKVAVTVAKPSLINRPVGLQIGYIDPSRNWVMDYVNVGEEDERKGDIKKIELNNITSRETAKIIGNYMFERLILDRKISTVLRPDAIKLNMADPFTFTCSALYLSGVSLRVSDLTLQPDNNIEVTAEYESTTLYDEDFNIDPDNVYNVSIVDPSSEPPSVQNVTVDEEVYSYRMRSFVRLFIYFDVPSDYPWFSHVEVYISFDDSTWKYWGEVRDDFYIDGLEEGVTYYIRLKTVNTKERKTQDNNDYKIGHYTTGVSTTRPPSLSSLFMAIQNNAVYLYSYRPLNEDDIYLYEFRLGASWSGAIFLGAFRSPNMSLVGVKPGVHTFYVNTYSKNKKYGLTPQQKTLTLPDPPVGFTITQTKSLTNKITNGNMELDSNWASVGSPTTQARSSEQSVDLTYSRKITVDAQLEGIQSDAFTTVNARKYGLTLHIYPSGITSIRVAVRRGNNASYLYEQNHTVTVNQWNEINIDLQEGGASGGSGAYIQITSPSGVSSGTFYVDGVIILEGDFSNNMAPIIYNGESYIKCRHVGSSYSGTYIGVVYDLTTSDRRMLYLLNDITIIGEGNYWRDRAPSPVKWSDLDVANKRWSDIWNIEEAPQVEEYMYYHPTSNPPTTVQEKLEIITAVCEGRYYQPRIKITDPGAQVFAYVEAYTLKFVE